MLKKLALAAGAIVLSAALALPVFSQTSPPIDTQSNLSKTRVYTSYSPLSPGQYTPVSDATATALTVPADATYAVVCFEGANHRYTWDGTTTPTASVGTLIGYGPGVCVSLTGAATIADFKTISVSAGGTFTASYAK